MLPGLIKQARVHACDAGRAVAGALLPVSGVAQPQQQELLAVLQQSVVAQQQLRAGPVVAQREE